MTQALVLCCTDSLKVTRRFSYIVREGREDEEMARVQDMVFSRPPDQVLSVVLGYRDQPWQCDFFNRKQQRCPGALYHDKSRHALHTIFFNHHMHEGAINFIYGPLKGIKKTAPDILYPLYMKKYEDVLHYAENRDLSVACPEEPGERLIYPITFNLYPAAYV